MTGARRPSIRVTAAVVAATGLLVAGCGSGSSSSGTSGTTSGAAARVGGTVTVALDEQLSGFNPLSATEESVDLGEILNNVWPSVYVIGPDLVPHLNTELVTSAKVVKTDPQTVVLHINPRATWSDGVPISAKDFAYNWRAQSGDPHFKDRHDQTFQPAATGGYSSIRSVSGSDRGKTVTIVFAHPYIDWRSLFSPLAPAHIAEKVGFNSGFANFGPAVKVSGGPYEIESYSTGEDLVETPNPHYWGPKPKLSKLVFRFFSDPGQEPVAVQNNEVQVVNPSSLSLPYAESLKGVSGFVTKIVPGLEEEYLDFNEANPYLADPVIRHALAYGTDRPEITARTVGLVAHGTTALNNRIFVPTQPQYVDTSGGDGAYNPAMARQLLRQAGMTMGSDGYFEPSSGPQKGKPLTFQVSTTAGNSVRLQIEELMQVELKQIGVRIQLANYPTNTLYGTVLPKGEYDLSESDVVLSPFASEMQNVYCSYQDCPSNWDHSSSKQVDALMQSGVTAASEQQETADFNNVDRILWKNMTTLPLYQDAQLTGWASDVLNIEPNTSNFGLTWNDEDWALKK